MTLKTIGIALSAPVINNRLDPYEFNKVLEDRILGRNSRYPGYFNRLSGVDEMVLKRRLAEGPQASFLFLPSLRWIDQHFRWWGREPRPDGGGGSKQFPALTPRHFGLLALSGAGLGMLCSRKRLQCCVLLLPTLLYLFGTYAVGDAVSRYLQPVEWVGFVFAGVLLDFGIMVCLFLWSQSRRLLKGSWGF